MTPATSPARPAPTPETLTRHWNRIDALFAKVEAGTITATETLSLKIACLEVINNPQDWHSDDVETCQLILEALPKPRYDRDAVNARIVAIANGEIDGPFKAVSS